MLQLEICPVKLFSSFITLVICFFVLMLVISESEMGDEGARGIELN